MRLPRFNLCHLLALIAVVTGLACDSDDPVTTPGPDAAPVWSEIGNLPSPITMYGLWAPRADLVVGVGEGGHIWQWDGQLWTERVSTSAADLFAIAGSTGGSVVAVGDDGTALEQVNGVFLPRNATTTEDLRGVWRSDSGLFVAAGTNGIIVRGDGSTWSADPTPTRASLFSVWGSGDGDIFAVGVNGTILHHDGVEWTALPGGTTEILSAVSGASANDVYVVGSGGTILHYDGTDWALMTSGTTVVLQSISVDGGPLAVGANGTVLRLAGGAWQSEKIPGAPWLYATARADGRSWAVGAHALFRHDGVQWSNESRGTIPVLRAVTSTAAGLVVVGDNGIVMRDGPDHWRIDDAGALQRLNAAWASPSGEIFAAGTNHIFRYTGTGWVVENNELIEYFDIGGNDQAVFAVGSGGAIRERQGTSWRVVSRTSDDLHAVAMDTTEGYMAGSNGVILHYDGMNLEIRYTQPGTTLWDILPVETDTWQAIAVGAGGVSLGRSREPGFHWLVMPTTVVTHLHSLAFGPGDQLYAAGASGKLLRLVNDQWTTVATPTSRTFLGASSRDGVLFLCGGNASSSGMLFRFGPPGP